MASLHGFNTWDEIADYIENTLDIHYTDDPTSWNDAMKTEMEGSRFVKIVDEVTGLETETIVPDSLYEGVGEFHTGANYQGQTVSGGGVKSAPTAKSVITENGSGGTAVITDEAIGVKDIGITSLKSPINILSGLMQVYGLIHTGVNIANAQVWKDMSNYVYDTDFTEDTPLERVIDFLGMKITNCVTDHWHAAIGDETLRINIPDSIAQRMYEFMANHMIQSQTPGIFPNVSIFPATYNYIYRTLELADQTQTLERYESAFDPTHPCTVSFVDISDDFFKECVLDYTQQLIGSGFTIAGSVITALAASMNGVYQFLKDQSVDAVENADIAHMQIYIERGAVPPPKETPLALSEFHITIACYHNSNYRKEYDGSEWRYYVNQNARLQDMAAWSSELPAPLSSGYSYQNGDCVRYLKRGKTGESDEDFAYGVVVQDKVIPDPTPEKETWLVRIGYPSNEQSMRYTYDSTNAANAFFINGFATEDVYTSPPAGSLERRIYSTLGLTGVGASYMPDDYLVTAGIRARTDVTGEVNRRPDPTKTKEEVYPEMNNKTQNARPQAQQDPETGDTVVNNYITNYVPASVPSGSDNADRLINHGLNNPDDPDSYIDNRPQNAIVEGRVNENDSVEGYNEDTDAAVKQFNESKNDPNHYPNPIPANEPNPQYPENPPSVPEGITDDPTSPSTLPGVTASGMVSVYNPTKAEVISFSSWLWTGNVFENIKKLLQDPMEAIIGMHIMYATPSTTTPSNIIVGWLDSGVSAKVVNQQYTQLDCGDVFVPEYYGDVLDYEPYVHIHLYLPFVGIVSLKPNDVIGKQVNVTYGIDALTGTCLAMVTTTKGSSKIQCYTFPGNCAVQIPLTGGSYASVIRGIASMAVGVAGSVATGNALGAVGGVIGGVMSSHLDVSHSGTLGANAGAMGVKKPYLIITRKVAYDAAGYNQFYGYPANKTVILGSCRGYTRVKSVHIESIPIATSDEKQQIETLLKQGVIIR